MIDDVSAVALGGIWALLLIAGVTVACLMRFRPERNYAETAQRTKSWCVMIALFTLAMAGGRTAMLWFWGFVSFLALKEFFSVIPTRRADRRVLFWAYLAVPAQYYWAGAAWYGMFIIFIPVYTFLFIPFRMVITQKTEGFLKAASAIHWGLMTCVFSLSHAAYLIMLPPVREGGPGGACLLIYLVFLTQFNDVAQYVFGKLLGKRPVIPAVSPKKTWEGLAGGVCCTTAAAVLTAPFLTPFDVLHALGAGALIGVFGFIGDVTVSAVKRDIGVKDMGSMIPGHGGVMDRVDSLTFTAPLFFHFVYFYYY